MEKLFLLDAYALIYRAYYAFIKNPRINSKGFNTSAILGFVNTLEEVLEERKSHSHRSSFRPCRGLRSATKLMKHTKRNGKRLPEAIRHSVPIIKDIIRAYRIPILEIAGYEADDVIGTLATEAGKRGINTYMMTPDKDYGQLVGEHVFMYRPKYGDKDFEVMGSKKSKPSSISSRHCRSSTCSDSWAIQPTTFPDARVWERKRHRNWWPSSAASKTYWLIPTAERSLKKKVEENKEQSHSPNFWQPSKRMCPSHSTWKH